MIRFITVAGQVSSFLERPAEKLGDSMKLFLGRLWAKVARDSGQRPEIHNATIGVRG